MPNFTLNSGTTAEKLAKTIRGLLFFAAPCTFNVSATLANKVDLKTGYTVAVLNSFLLTKINRSTVVFALCYTVACIYRAN